MKLNKILLMSLLPFAVVGTNDHAMKFGDFKNNLIEKYEAQSFYWNGTTEIDCISNLCATEEVEKKLQQKEIIQYFIEAGEENENFEQISFWSEIDLYLEKEYELFAKEQKNNLNIVEKLKQTLCINNLFYKSYSMSPEEQKVFVNLKKYQTVCKESLEQAAHINEFILDADERKSTFWQSIKNEFSPKSPENVSNINHEKPIEHFVLNISLKELIEKQQKEKNSSEMREFEESAFFLFADKIASFLFRQTLEDEWKPLEFLLPFLQKSEQDFTKETQDFFLKIQDLHKNFSFIKTDPKYQDILKTQAFIEKKFRSIPEDFLCNFRSRQNAPRKTFFSTPHKTYNTQINENSQLESLEIWVFKSFLPKAFFERSNIRFDRFGFRRKLYYSQDNFIVFRNLSLFNKEEKEMLFDAQKGGFVFVRSIVSTFEEYSEKVLNFLQQEYLRLSYKITLQDKEQEHLSYLTTMLSGEDLLKTLHRTYQENLNSFVDVMLDLRTFYVDSISITKKIQLNYKFYSYILKDLENERVPLNIGEAYVKKIKKL